MGKAVDQGSDVRFHTERPKNIRRATPWHRYAHHIRMLPAGLARLARDLDTPTTGRVLDYGCADVPYRRLFSEAVEYVAADIEGNPQSSMTLNPDGTVPAQDESFDALLSTQVLEHVSDPELYLSECFRVLKPGGRMLLSTHGIFGYHPDPVDYWRWTNAGLRRVITGAGFEIVRFEGIIGLAATGLQLFQDAFYWHLPRRVRPLFALVLQTLVAVVDRLPQRSTDYDAQVFAVVAERP